ncbi:MAG TPA: hypothetical protein VFX39_02185, partial [Gemmatimonadaceae bacterium]|nr:hypothetical protein [Gemmatimonadaceae bacterium]
PQMARLVTKYPTDPVIRTESGASHYRLIGLEVTAAPEATLAYSLITLGTGTSTENTLDKLPHHLVLDRMYVHGHPTLDFQRCISLQSGEAAIIDSWISECHGKGKDSQAIAGWNGSGPYLIENNFLEGAGENVMFGGADPKIPGMLPRDITLRRNHFYKDPAWIRADGYKIWTVKNLFELKIGQRVLVEGNVFENNWADGQDGFAILLKSANQSGGAPWSETSDVVFRYNVVRNVAHGVNLSDDPNGTAVPASRMTFAHNVLERVGTGDYRGGRLWQLAGVDGLTITHNSHNLTTGGGTHAFMLLKKEMTGLVITNNIFPQTTYGVFGDGLGAGSAAFTPHPGANFTGNVVAGVPASRYPRGNAYPAATQGSAWTVNEDGVPRPRRGSGTGAATFASGSAGPDFAEVARQVRGVRARLEE